MKKLLLLFIAGLILAMSAQAREEELVGAMLFVVAPVNDDPEGYEAAISVCSCAIEMAQKVWDSVSFANFTDELVSYAKVVELTVSSQNSLMASGALKKSESLIKSLERLAPYILECENKYDTRVEF